MRRHLRSALLVVGALLVPVLTSLGLFLGAQSLKAQMRQVPPNVGLNDFSGQLWSLKTHDDGSGNNIVSVYCESGCSGGTISGAVNIADPVTPSRMMQINASGQGAVNLGALSGTAIDTNSGVKSAGTIRTVQATDQPSMTNAQPANTTQLAGTAISTGFGNVDAGTARLTPALNGRANCPNVLPFSQTGSADLHTMTNKGRICSFFLISATAQSVSLVEGTGSTCGTGTAALVGGTSASVALPANGGFTAIAQMPWLDMQTTADHLCLLQSGAGNVSGVITYSDN